MSAVRTYLEKKLGVDHISGHTFYAGPLGINSIVVDLGSHKGAFSEYLHKKYGCQCYAVEASPFVFSNARLSPAIKKFNLAIASQDGPVVFNVLDDPEASYIGSEAQGITNRLTIDGRTLKSFLKSQGLCKVDLLKMDIEGEEIPLLEKTDDETLLRFKQITIEFHDFLDRLRREGDRVARIKKRLERLDFSLINFSAPRNLNCLFINKKHLKVYSFAFLYMFALAFWINLRRRLGLLK